MPILMKKFLSKHSQLLLTLVFGICVFIFWRMRYPFALTFQEQLQLFLFDDDYFLERIAEPGGLARYVAEFLVQFYNSVTMGAVIIAILMMLVQRLTWRLMRCEEHYCLTCHIIMVCHGRRERYADLHGGSCYGNGQRMGIDDSISKE